MRSNGPILSPASLAGLLFFLITCAARVATAQATSSDLRPPTLQTRGDALYPEEARRLALEGNVGLELVVGDDGRVVDAKVTASAGHGFDEAALDAARNFVFVPAQQGGMPIRSLVQFTYEFHLPAEASPPTVPPPVAAASEPAPPQALQAGPDQSSLVLAQRPISAASSFAVRDREFQPHHRSDRRSWCRAAGRGNSRTRRG